MNLASDLMRRAWLACSLSLGLLVAPGAAQENASCDECPGAVWYVRAGSKASNPDGKAWGTAYPRLQDAIGRADNGDCIWVAAGRYYTSASGVRSQSFKFDKSLSVYGGFAGDETCFGARAGLFSATHLSGEIGNPATRTDNAYTVVDLSGAVSFYQPSPQVLLDGFRIQGAYSLGGHGGGVHLGEHAMVLRNCVIANNVSGYGAGIHARACKLDLVNCTIRGNRARFDGGGMWLGGVSSGVDPGGGTYVTNVVVRGNTAKAKGGGFYLADTSLTGVQPLIAVNTLLRDNTARRGGAGYLEEAQSAGGLFLSAKAELTNCTVVGNASTAAGAVKGAAFVVEDSLYLLARNAQLDLTNCIVWDNLPATPASPAIVAITGEGLLVSYSILGAGSPHACQPALACTNELGCTVFDCDPLFLPVPPYHPDPLSSPAVDSGLSFLPPDVFDLDGDGDLLEGTPLDLDGDVRVQGVVDRGAYEAP